MSIDTAAPVKTLPPPLDATYEDSRQVLAKQNVELAVVNGWSRESAGCTYAASLLSSAPGPD